ncbi:MAG: hypothetical protein HY074_09825 [Deltaproteobacteria bacterium]|nr:hypothetical protein [Deltaproteobacteria bacterium]
MRDILGTLLICFAFGSPLTAFADATCEAKIEATKMYVLPSDPKTICETNPTAAIQDCMVNLLKAGKGKLRNQDFLEVYGLCDVDSSQEVQDCFKNHLDKAYNDPGYKGAQLIGDRCLMERKRFSGVKFMHLPTPPKKKKDATAATK